MGQQWDDPPAWPAGAEPFAMVRWRWRRWRARHYVVIARWVYYRWPTERNGGAWIRAADYAGRVEAGRP